MFLDGCQRTSISTETRDIEHENEFEAELHIEQLCKLYFRVNIQEMPESGQTLEEIYNVSPLISHRIARRANYYMYIKTYAESTTFNP